MKKNAVDPRKDAQPWRRASADPILTAFHSASPVFGSTHTFYRYPARFSPQFAKAVIDAFTHVGDVVLDPFMGGGTTIVEALATGRKAVGCDINSLAGFLADAKTTFLSPTDIARIHAWCDRLPRVTHFRRQPKAYAREDRHRHVPWWLRKTIQLGIEASDVLASERQRMFARCSLAKTAQWALDSKKVLPSKQDFLKKHRSHTHEMLRGLDEYAERIRAQYGRSWRSAVRQQKRILVRSAAGLEHDPLYPSDWDPPALILTSPPYVGVHVLYHRWQVQGRRETPAPYWIVGKPDGHFGSFYTFGDRKRGIDIYLDHMRPCFQSLVAVMSHRTTLVQLVAFAEPAEHLPIYLQELEKVGLVSHSASARTLNGLHVRTVPNRKWYADALAESGGSREFLLIHTKR